MKPFEHYLRLEARKNDLRDEQWQIERDRRREKERRKTETVTSVCCVLIWVAFLVIAIVISMPWAVAEDEEPVAQAPVVIVMPEIPVEEIPEDFENEKIEAALLDQGYLRDDIPLDYDTQALLRAACDESGVEFELALAVIRKETTYRNVVGDYDMKMFESAVKYFKEG